MSGTSSDSVLARLRCVFPQQSTGKLECVIKTQRQRAGLDTTICDEILLQKCVEHLLTEVKCAQCGKAAPYQCGRCKLRYCTRACQKKHWNNGHKQACLGSRSSADTEKKSDGHVKRLNPECDASRKRNESSHDMLNADCGKSQNGKGSLFDMLIDSHCRLSTPVAHSRPICIDLTNDAPVHSASLLTDLDSDLLDFLDDTSDTDLTEKQSRIVSSTSATVDDKLLDGSSTHKVGNDICLENAPIYSVGGGTRLKSAKKYVGKNRKCLDTSAVGAIDRDTHSSSSTAYAVDSGTPSENSTVYIGDSNNHSKYLPNHNVGSTIQVRYSAISAISSDTQAGNLALSTIKRDTHSEKSAISTISSDTQAGNLAVSTISSDAHSEKSAISTISSDTEAGNLTVSTISSDNHSEKSAISTISSDTEAGNLTVSTISSDNHSEKSAISTISSDTQAGNLAVSTISSDNHSEKLAISTVPRSTHLDSSVVRTIDSNIHSEHSSVYNSANDVCVNSVGGNLFNGTVKADGPLTRLEPMVVRCDATSSNDSGKETDVEEHVALVLSVFPDADRTWVTENLRSKQLSHPDSFVFYVCEMLIESRHDNRETNSKETSGKKTSPSEHSSKRKTSCSIEKVKNSQKYVDVLSEKADHIEMWNRPFRDVDDDGEPSSPKKPQLESDMQVDIPCTPEGQPTSSSQSNSIEVVNDMSSQFQCNTCGAYKEGNELAQCCDGHILCQKCIEPEVKVILTSENQLHINCPVIMCESEIPTGEAKKILPSMVIDLLQEKLEKYCLQSINNMPDIFKCPDCGVPVAMAPGNKEFQCQNEDCMMTCCRYCKKPWNDGDHVDCSLVLSAADHLSSVDQLPHHWDPMPDKDTDFISIELQRESEEYQTVEERFRQTMPHSSRLKAIRRIQNPRLWQRYLLARKHFLDDFEMHQLNEQLLFHGSNRGTVDAICKEGFDWRLCGQHGTAFGRGTYFAKNAVYSETYCNILPTNAVASHRPPVKKTKGSKWMLCARVLCGRMTAGHQRMLRPPPDESDAKQRPFNSAVDSLTSPTVFVIFESSQTYPEYVLEFVSTPNSTPIS